MRNSEWQRFRQSRPGRRFQERYQRHRDSDIVHPLWRRMAMISFGILIILVGIVFAFIPGPAILFYAIGGAIIAKESKWMATSLDRCETIGRTWMHRTKMWWNGVRKRF